MFIFKTLCMIAVMSGIFYLCFRGWPDKEEGDSNKDF